MSESTERAAFDKAYDAIPAITSTRETAWRIWNAARASHPRIKDTPYGPAILLNDLRDAERYRWLRDKAVNHEGPSPWCVYGTDHGDSYPVIGRKLDSVIDAAMSPPLAGEQP